MVKRTVRHIHSHLKGFIKLDKKLAILLALIIIAAIIFSVFFKFLYPKKQIIDTTIDLTKGNVVDLKDNLGFYIEQSADVCDQNNLSKAFKSFAISSASGKPTKSGAGSIYGETTWNYILQGEISNILPASNGIKYTLISGLDKLITQTTNNTISWKKDPTSSPSSNLVPTKIDASTFALKDKVQLYYLVKCGGNKPPLLFLEYIQKITTPPKQANTTASSSGSLRSSGNDLSNFYGQVKEKGANYLILYTGNQTIKVVTPNNIPVKIVPKSVLTSNAEFKLHIQATQDILISSIKKDDFINVTGKYDGNSLTADVVVVYR